MVRQFWRTYRWLLVVTAMLCGFFMAYAISGAGPSQNAQLIGSYTFPFAVLFWIQADARKRRCTPCFDFGLFLYMFPIFLVPGYLLWTRRFAGVLVALFLLLLYCLPWLVAVLVWIIVRAMHA